MLQVDFNPRHYLTMTKSGLIRVNEYRLGNQEPISPRKDAVYLAQRFLHQAQVRTSVHNLLFVMIRFVEVQANLYNGSLFFGMSLLSSSHQTDIPSSRALL